MIKKNSILHGNSLELLKQIGVVKLQHGVLCMTQQQELKEALNKKDLYSQINILDRAVFDSSGPVERKGNSYKVPNYSTVDASLRHGFNLGEFDTTVTVRVNNLLDTEYIADAFDAVDPLVWFGFGRTFSLDVKIKF